MTRNVLLVVEGFAAYAAGDRAKLLSLLHPDVEIVPLAPDLMGTDGPYHGHEGAERWLEDLGTARQEFSGEADATVQEGPTVLVLRRVQALRAASGYG